MLETQQSQQKYSSFVMIFPVTSGKTSKDSSNRFDGIHFCDDNVSTMLKMDINPKFNDPQKVI